MKSEKALLVVSFGTSVPETREHTITACEKALCAAFPDRAFYRAWTSGVICRKIERTEGLHVDSVAEALERMAADGVRDVLVQTTHVLCGEETRLMREALEKKREAFARITVGEPILSSERDLEELCDFMVGLWDSRREDELFAWMGHGSNELEENVYETLNERLRARGRDDICVGTVEFSPGFEAVRERVYERKPRRVTLAPLMIVAGDHAVNDMSGDEPDSWKSMLEAEGIEVECILRGLGEYEAVRAMLVAHAMAAAEL